MKNILTSLFEYESLSSTQACNLLHSIAKGEYTNEQIASLITVFLMRDISTGELDGFRNALLELRTPVDLNFCNTIDIVGTGGDGKDTFNISTCASFVVAGAGYSVIKHGNYGATSISGASNVIESCGAHFTNNTDTLRRSIEKSGMAYLHAPLFNPAMKAVAAIRKNLGVRSFFNMLGPLVNPAQPTYSLLGVYNLPLLRLYNYMYQNDNAQYGVVYSLDGYDEISLTCDFKVCSQKGEKIYSPSQIGFNKYLPNELTGAKTTDEAAKIFISVLENRSTKAQKDCVIANAAFAINVIEPTLTISECIDKAKHSIESGEAERRFKLFIDINS